MGQSGPGNESGSGGTGAGRGSGGQGSRPPGNRPAGTGSRGTGGQARRPASQSQRRATGSRPPVRREADTPPQTGFRATIDRALPPFSIQRYVAIWVLGMIPLVLVLFLLLRPGGNTGGNSGAAVGNCPTPSEAGKYFVLDTVKGCIVTRLYTDPAANVANTIANFERRANAGEFNGRIFHRVEDWVIQGGDPEGTGSGGGRMPSEYNNLPFKAGSLGIARGPDPAQNNDSQFFITKQPAEYLNGQYTNWGEVVQGQDVVDKIAIGDKINSAAVVTR